MKKYAPFVILLLITFTTDFFRDYIFVNLNYQIHYLTYLDFNYTDSFIEKYVSGYSFSELTRIKWMMSFFFIGLFALFSYLLIHFQYKSFKKKFQFLMLLFFFIILLFSSVSYLIYSQINDISTQNSFYYISMELSHYLQSSLSFITLFMIFELYQLFNTTSTQ